MQLSGPLLSRHHKDPALRNRVPSLLMISMLILPLINTQVYRNTFDLGHGSHPNIHFFCCCCSSEYSNWPRKLTQQVRLLLPFFLRGFKSFFSQDLLIGSYHPSLSLEKLKKWPGIKLSLWLQFQYNNSNSNTADTVDRHCAQHFITIMSLSPQSSLAK